MTAVRMAFGGVAAILLCTGCTSLQRDVGWDRSPRVEAQDLELALLSYEANAQGLHARLLIRNLGDRGVLLPGGGGRPVPWLTASSAGHPFSVAPALESLAGDGIDAPITRVVIPCSAPITIAPHSSLFVDADMMPPGSFSPDEDAWTVTLTGQRAAGGAVALTLVVPADHSPDPRAIRQWGRP